MMVLAPRFLGRGHSEPGHLNALRMELERSPKVSLARRGLSDSPPGGALRGPLPRDFCHQVRPLSTPS